MVSAKIKDNTAIYVLLHHKKRKSNCNFFASLVSKTAFRLTEQPPMETKLRGKTHQNIQIHRSWKVQKKSLNKIWTIGSHKKYTNTGKREKNALITKNHPQFTRTREIHGTKKNLHAYRRLTCKNCGRETYCKHKYFSSSTL